MFRDENDCLVPTEVDPVRVWDFDYDIVDDNTRLDVPNN